MTIPKSLCGSWISFSNATPRTSALLQTFQSDLNDYLTSIGEDDPTFEIGEAISDIVYVMQNQSASDSSYIILANAIQTLLASQGCWQT
jgi:hypothetical protein